MQHLTINPQLNESPLRDASAKTLPTSLPPAKETKLHPRNTGGENASLFFVGTATLILEWEGIRIMTDPNFLHAGDHVHLGPGVTSKRLTNPAIDLHELPRIDLVLLSHYHRDHFDQEVEASLRRSLPIITTPHAKDCLQSKGPSESFTHVYALETFESMIVDVGGEKNTEAQSAGSQPAIKVTAMPGKHVPPGPLDKINDILGAVPPTNGWMVELGRCASSPSPSSASLFDCGFRIYITGDTLLVPELKSIPERYSAAAGHPIDLMLAHLGGTVVPGPSMPLLMVTMDAKMGVELIRLVDPDVTIPIHYDDYDVMVSPLFDFQRAVTEAGLVDRVVYLDRKDGYRFRVR